MKTLREVLFEKHQTAEPRLDAIREQVVAGLAPDGKAETPVRSKRKAGDWQPERPGWGQFLWSLRWHLAGLSAVWLVVLALSIDHSAAPAPEAARQAAPSSRQLLAALRQNQRQLRELIRASAAELAPKPQKPAPSPRSQIQLLPAVAI